MDKKQDFIITLGSMSTYEFEEKLKDIKIALIPTGSTEQHGPNMALETDTSIAYGLSIKIAQALIPKAVVIPPIAFGLSDHHMGYKGTITLRPETYFCLLEDIVYSLKKHGITLFIFINGHAGNKDCLKILCSKLRHRQGIKIASMFYFELANDIIKSNLKSRIWGHGDEIEASMAIYLGIKYLLKPDSMAAGDVVAPLLPNISMSGEPGIYFPLTFEEKTLNGAQGDARNACYETGKLICDTVVKRMVEFSKKFIEL